MSKNLPKNANPVPLQKLEVVITKTYFSSPTFTAGKLKIKGKDKEESFSGKIFLQEGDSVIIECRDAKHPVYGPQKEIESFSYNEKLDTDGLKQYLAKNPAMKGIGPVKAAAIAAAGDLTENLKDITLFSAKTGVKQETLELLKVEWEKRKGFAETLVKLAGLGFSNNAINKLLKEYGNNLLNVLKTNPYILIGLISGYGFKKTDELARRFGIDKCNPERIASCLKYLLNENENAGHCWISREDLINQANKDLVIDSLNSKPLINEQLVALLKSNVAMEYKECVGKTNTFDAESKLLKSFKSVSKNLKPQLQKWPTCISNLNEKQREALDMFLEWNQCLIGGIAGAGKSYLLYCLVEYCKAAGLEYIVLSPTGKACKRLEELISEETFTIHRVLGYNGNTFEKTNPRLKKADIVIVDEVSMVDVHILSKLYSELDFASQNLVLAGDFQQLPPVGAGNVLRDIIKQNLLPQVLLVECMRQAGELKENCNKILKGTVAQTSKHNIGITQRKPWFKVTCFKTPEEIQGYIRSTYFNTLIEKYEYDLLKDVQILTPTHKGPLGTVELNKIVQKIVHKKLYGVNIPDNEKTVFYVGDKVINKKNKYDLGIMNGDVGYVKEVKSWNNILVEFNGQKVRIQDDDVKDIYLAYALTIHSMQGSEVMCSFIILHKSHAYQLDANLMYTATTRSRQTSVLVGDLWAMTHAAHRTRVNDRKTFLSILEK